MSKTIGPQDGLWMCRPSPHDMLLSYAASIRAGKTHIVMANETHVADDDLNYMRQRMEEIKADRDFAFRAHGLRDTALRDEDALKAPVDETPATPRKTVPAEEQQPGETDFAFIARRCREIAAQEGGTAPQPSVTNSTTIIVPVGSGISIAPVSIARQVINNGILSSSSNLTSKLKCLNCGDNGWSYNDALNDWYECVVCGNPKGIAPPGNNC